MNNMLSLQDYQLIATKTILKFAKNPKRILNNIDDYDYVVSFIMNMESQNRFNPEKKCTISTFRINCARWAIAHIQSKYKRKKKEISLSSITVDISDSQLEPYQHLERRESLSLLDSLLNNNILTQFQKQILHLRFYEKKTLNEIGKIVGYSHQAVKNHIDNTLLQLRKIMTHRTINNG